MTEQTKQVLKRYNRIFKGTNLWEAHASFLLEELKLERQRVIDEVEEWAGSKRIVNTSGGFGHHMHNGLLTELSTKLNQLKGSHD